MDSTKIVKLVKETITHGNYGQEIITETSSTVFGRLYSVTRNEWTDAGQRGVEANFRLDVYTFEYNGEKIVELDGVRYGVYRTYIRVNEDITELYLHTVNGVTNIEEEAIPEEELETYVNIYNTLSSTGIPTFYGFAPNRQSLPFIVYSMDSNNFDADDKVYASGYDLTVNLYTSRKSLHCEKLLQTAFNNSDIAWEREETDNLDERVFVQTYSASIIGGD